MTGSPHISELWTSPSVTRLFDTSDLGFTLVGVDSTILDASSAFCKLLGYSREELLGKTIVDITHPEDQATSRQSFAIRARLEDTHLYEKRYITKSGESIWVRIRSVGVRKDGGEVTYRIVMVENCSAEKESELHLEQMAAIVEQSDDAIFRMTTEGIIQYWSRGAEQLYGYKAEEVLNTHPLFLVANNDEPKIREVPERLMRGEVVSDPFGLTRHKDGHLLNVSVQLCPLTDEFGNTVAFAGVHRDVGELKLLEEQLRHSQRMETAGLLAGGIAHDFNNILTVIQGACSGLVRDIPLTSPLQQYLELIDRSADKASRLTRQLLAFSRKQPIKPQIIDPVALLQEFMPMLMRTMGEKIELHVEFRSTSRVLEDPTQLEQIVLNLCINARYALPMGGAITVATDDVTYSSAMPLPSPGQHELYPLPLQRGRFVRLTVKDNGAGMDPLVMARIFEPFFTTKPKGEGTGLGLAVVYGIVMQSGGAIKVESEPGRGSSFQIFLPVTEGVTEPVGKVQPVAVNRSKGRILIIEDDADVRALIVEMLEAAGFAVIEAGNPWEVLEMQPQPVVDLILTDVVMPKMSGPEFAKLWLNQHPSASFLFMSGYFDESRFPDQFNKQNLMLKPFKPDELIRRIELQLGLKRATNAHD
jgi:two-component system cell cycle sensor histidine kinase/response regulator CckA